MKLKERFKQEAAKLVPAGTTTLLAVSGGVDSMVMADLFLTSGISFAVAHCNFQLRGSEADLDEQMVTDWCQVNGVSFHVARFDTKAKSEEWKKGIQETARILRYEWFEQIRSHHKYGRIATAHHANDNVETVLINLFKGTGISGLHGIRPDSGNIIRPLLFATRDEIAAYAAENEIHYREDASNASDDYLRNAVRHNLVPEIEKLFPQGVLRANESISRFAEAEILYQRALQQEIKKLMEQRGQDMYIPVRKLRLRTPLNTLVYELLKPYGFSSAQTLQIIGLMDAESGHYIASATHRVIKNRDFLIITQAATEEADLVVIEGVPCTIHAGRYTFDFSVKEYAGEIVKGANVAMIDTSRLTFPLLLRKWKTGDYFYPLGMDMKKKKVSRMLIHEKVALHEKEHIWVLESHKRIAWVAGVRLDERFKIKPATTQVLVVKRTVNNNAS